MTEEEITRTAGELRLVLGRLVRRARTSDDMPLAQAGVLGYLDRDGPLTTSELAVAQGVRQQSMARTVAQLLAAGLVAPQPHPTDGRKVLLTITPAGLEVLTRRRSVRVEWLSEAIATRHSPAEQETLANAVGLLARLAD